MLIIVWLLVGTIAGFIGSRITQRQGDRIYGDMVVGAAGALAGGFLFSLLGTTGLHGVSVWNTFVAATVSVMLLVAYYKVWLPRQA